MPDYATCAYYRCRQPFIRTRADRLYCCIQCTNKAAAARMRARGKEMQKERREELLKLTNEAAADAQRITAALGTAPSDTSLTPEQTGKKDETFEDVLGFLEKAADKKEDK